MKLKDFDLGDLLVLAGMGVAVIAVVAVAVGVFGHLYSSLDCEFRPMSERCTVLHERKAAP